MCKDNEIILALQEKRNAAMTALVTKTFEAGSAAGVVEALNGMIADLMPGADDGIDADNTLAFPEGGSGDDGSGEPEA